MSEAPDNERWRKITLMSAGGLCILAGWGLLLVPLFSNIGPGWLAVLFFLPGGILIWQGDKLFRRGYVI